MLSYVFQKIFHSVYYTQKNRQQWTGTLHDTHDLPIALPLALSLSLSVSLVSFRFHSPRIRPMYAVVLFCIMHIGGTAPESLHYLPATAESFLRSLRFRGTFGRASTSRLFLSQPPAATAVSGEIANLLCRPVNIARQTKSRNTPGFSAWQTIFPRICLVSPSRENTARVLGNFSKWMQICESKCGEHRLGKWMLE